MALQDGVLKALNDQMNREFYSSHLYLAMAGYFEKLGLKGCANWMTIQTEEERMHALKFYTFITNRGGAVEIGNVEAPPQNWDSPLHVFQETLKHEQFITQNINELANTSLSAKDHATHSFLQFFVD